MAVSDVILKFKFVCRDTMIKRSYICLSVVSLFLCLITSCKKESQKNDIPSSVEADSLKVKKSRKDLVIRDDKNENENTDSANCETNINDLNSKSDCTDEEEQIIPTRNKIYDVAEVLPMFPGGLQELNKYISGKTSKLEETKTLKVSVRTMVSCIVEEDGTLSEVTVARSSGNDSLDSKAVDIVSNMPAWSPAQNNGTNIRMKYIIPIIFNPNNN